MTSVPFSTTRVRPGAGRRFRPQGDIRVQPRRELLLAEKDRHPIVNFRSEVVRLGDDHRAGLEPLAGVAIFPLVPKSCRCQQRRQHPLVGLDGKGSSMSLIR